MKEKQGKLFIISGPAGAGKKALIEGIKSEFDAERVITTSTRDPRAGESEGDPYYFITKEEFKRRVEAGEFIEWAIEMNGNYYGGSKSEVNRVINSGKVGVWEIEYKGVITAKEIFPQIIAILINAPLESLERRIRNRDKDRATEEYIKERMDYNREWLKHKDIYDYEVMNCDGGQEKALASVIEIINKETNIDKK